MSSVFDPEYTSKPIVVNWKAGEIPGSRVAVRGGKKICYWPASGKWFAMRDSHTPDTPFPSFDSEDEARAYAAAPWLAAWKKRDDAKRLEWEQAKHKREERAARAKAKEDKIIAKRRKHGDKTFGVYNADNFCLGFIVRRTEIEATLGAAKLLGFNRLPTGCYVKVVK